jgi:hypothetical protein
MQRRRLSADDGSPRAPLSCTPCCSLTTAGPPRHVSRPRRCPPSCQSASPPHGSAVPAAPSTQRSPCTHERGTRDGGTAPPLHQHTHTQSTHGSGCSPPPRSLSLSPGQPPHTHRTPQVAGGQAGRHSKGGGGGQRRVAPRVHGVTALVPRRRRRLCPRRRAGGQRRRRRRRILLQPPGREGAVDARALQSTS